MACPKQPSAGPLRTLYRIIKAHQTNIYIVITLFFDISFYKFDSFACKNTKKKYIPQNKIIILYIKNLNI